jgi:hypothetical protein
MQVSAYETLTSPALGPESASHILAEYLCAIGPTDDGTNEAGSAFIQLLRPELDELAELYGRDLDGIYPGMEEELGVEFGVRATIALLTLPANAALEAVVALFNDTKAELRERIDAVNVPA